MDIKNMTLRLPREQADDLELVATVDGRSMSEEIREALQEHVSRKRQDPEFQARLSSVLKNNNAALRRLSQSS